MQETSDNRPHNPHKTLWLILRITVACLVLGIVFWNQRWSELVGVFSGLNWGYFLLALAIFVVCQVVLAMRWWLLVYSQGISLGIWVAVRLHFIGLFYNNVMPSAIGGDFLRAWYVTRHTRKRVEAALSVFVDRAIGLLGIFLMALSSYLFYMRGVSLEGPTETPAHSTSHGHLALWLWGGGLLLAGVALSLFHPATRAGLGRLFSGLFRKVVLVRSERRYFSTGPGLGSSWLVCF